MHLYQRKPCRISMLDVARIGCFFLDLMACVCSCSGLWNSISAMLVFKFFRSLIADLNLMSFVFSVWIHVYRSPCRKNELQRFLEVFFKLFNDPHNTVSISLSGYGHGTTCYVVIMHSCIPW